MTGFRATATMNDVLLELAGRPFTCARGSDKPGEDRSLTVAALLNLEVGRESDLAVWQANARGDEFQFRGRRT